jgi:hypothetical protein
MVATSKCCSGTGAASIQYCTTYDGNCNVYICRKANKNPGKVTEVSYSFYKVKKGKISDFDPRPETKRHLSKENKNNFVTELNAATWLQRPSAAAGQVQLASSTAPLMMEIVMCTFRNSFRMDAATFPFK